MLNEPEGGVWQVASGKFLPASQEAKYKHTGAGITGATNERMANEIN